MKRLFQLILLINIFVLCRKVPSRILLFIEDSQQISYIVTHEVRKMEEELIPSGFKITTVTLSEKAGDPDHLSPV